MLHSRIIIDGPHAFYGTHIRELAFHDSIIESLNHGAFSGGIVEKLVLNNTRFYNIDDAFVLRNHSNILTSVFHPELLDELELRRKGAFENNQISFDIGGERGVSSPSSPSCSFDANGAPAAGSKCGEESSLSCSNSDDLCVLTSNNNTHSNGVFSIRTANNMCVKITSIVLIALSIKKSFIYYNLRMVIHI